MISSLFFKLLNVMQLQAKRGKYHQNMYLLAFPIS